MWENVNIFLIFIAEIFVDIFFKKSLKINNKLIAEIESKIYEKYIN